MRACVCVCVCVCEEEEVSSACEHVQQDSKEAEVRGGHNTVKSANWRKL